MNDSQVKQSVYCTVALLNTDTDHSLNIIKYQYLVPVYRLRTSRQIIRIYCSIDILVQLLFIGISLRLKASRKTQNFIYKHPLLLQGNENTLFVSMTAISY